MSKGLYIHIPFCVRKCKYCDFISFCGKEDRFDEYISSLLREAGEYKGEKLDTIFIGGGTPSVLSDVQLKRLIGGLYDNFKVDPECEFSIEANPKTLNENKLSALKECGVNRISIGVQSFCDEELSAIGRIHNAEIAEDTIEMIKSCGFDNFNIDIMLNLPHTSKDNLKKTLLKAIALEPTHISCYSLILEEGTVLYDEYQKGIYKETDDEYDRELCHYAVNTLKGAGFIQYEISNFAKKGYECRHNIKYWNCDEYIGLGVAAHSYVDGVRYFNTSDLEEYIKGRYRTGERDVLSKKDKISEYIIMRLRLTEGIDEAEFKKCFGVRITDIYGDKINGFIKAELMKYESGKYSLTERGFDISNSVLCEFV